MRLTGHYFELTDRLPQAAQPRASTTPVLVISVAKRIVKSAVRRNTVKRVVREAWRGGFVEAATRDGHSNAWMMRLRAHPVPKSPTGAVPVPGFAAVKKLLRADADQLFAQALRTGRRRARTVNSSPVDRQVPGTPA